MTIERPRTCGGCGKTIAASSSVCSNCGSIVDGDSEMECENHSTERARAVCVVCGKPVCGDCAMVQNARWFCDILAHRNLEDEWMIVAKLSSGFEADMVEVNLRQNGVQTLRFSQSDYSASFFLREPPTDRIFAKRYEEEKAFGIITRLGVVVSEKE